MEQPNQTTESIFSSDQDMTQAMADLTKSSKWMKFLAVVGFIALGFVALVGLLVLLVPQGSVYPSLIILILGTVILFPVLFLFKYSRGIQKFQLTGNHEDLEAAFESQRKYWVYYGVLMSLYLLGSILIMLLLAIYGMTILQLIQQLK
jgi:hypothetical protein